MSTDESDSITSSQIRRFGLYRTIDARTEEFQRLSKKKQMRQVCTCAAISTTITVTVVVSFILICKYSTISEAPSRTTLTPNWLNLMNSSVNDLPFEVKLDKAKTYFDTLKTLKKHKYFDKYIEEPSSPNPLEDIRGPIEHTNNKNIFSDTRNWMRMPTSRLYTIEYKTSPIVYFKNPTRNIDYFKKDRKIRDYQRIMNYVDKMISERVTFGSTQPMNKNIYNIHKNAVADLTTPMMMAKEYEITTQKTRTIKTKTISDKKHYCNCPKRINELLNKLIVGIHSLLPTFYKNNSSTSTKSCKHFNVKNKSPQSRTLKPKLKSIFKSYNYSTRSVAVTSTMPYVSQQTSTVLPEIDYTLNAIIALLKPSIQHGGINENKLFSLKSATTKSYVDRTNSYKLEDTTNTMDTSATLLFPNSAITIRDFILKSHSIQTSKPFLSFPVNSEREYEDYFETTSKSNIGARDQHNLELMERKNISNKQGPNSNVTKSKTSSPCKMCKEGSYKLLKNKNLLKKMTKVNFSSTVSPHFNSDMNWQSNGKTQSLSMGITTISPRSSSEINLKNETTVADLRQATTENKKMEQTLKFDDVTLEEETEKIFYEDVTPEEDLKNLENILKKLNTSNVYNETTTTENSELYEWELIKIEDKYDTREDIKSMIPQDRASYLEIQRNEWRPDEQQDYDNNINQYLFE